jgi:hypothetical protein
MRKDRYHNINQNKYLTYRPPALVLALSRENPLGTPKAKKENKEKAHYE